MKKFTPENRYGEKEKKPVSMQRSLRQRGDPEMKRMKKKANKLKIACNFMRKYTWRARDFINRGLDS